MVPSLLVQINLSANFKKYVEKIKCFSICVNDICERSPSRIRIVRRISLGITTLPRSSILLTIPVAFILNSLKTTLWDFQGYCLHSMRKISIENFSDKNIYFPNSFFMRRRYLQTPALFDTR